VRGPLSKEAPLITGHPNVVQSTKILGFCGLNCVLVTEGITVVWIAFLCQNALLWFGWRSCDRRHYCGLDGVLLTEGITVVWMAFL
jgi:hypothetical protein